MILGFGHLERGIPKKLVLDTKDNGKAFCLAKAMPKTRFFGQNLEFVCPAGPRARLNPPPKFQKCPNSVVMIFDQKLVFRLLKDPKRLGLGEKSLGKYSFGPNGVRFMAPKKEM